MEGHGTQPFGYERSTNNDGCELISGESADRSDDNNLVSLNSSPRLRLASRHAGHFTLTQDVDRRER